MVLGTSHDATECMRVDEQVQLQHRRAMALREIDQAITSSPNLSVMLDVLLAKLMAQLNVDATDVLLLNPQTKNLEYAAGRGFRSSAIAQARFVLGEGLAGRAALECRVMQAHGLPENRDAGSYPQAIANEGFVTQYALPLIAKGQIKGVLQVFHRAPLDPDRDWLDYMETLAGQAAIAVDSAEMFDQLQRSNIELMLAYDTTLEGWSRALDLRDKATEGHTQRVAEIVVCLARVMGVRETEVLQIRRGALLHDIGKMGIPDSILLKPGPLTDSEWEIMRRHPEYAYDMLSRILYLSAALDIPRYHHEKWDGAGYPHGLKGEQIPLAARIFAVVDVWDALRSDRPYRVAWSEEKVVAHIRSRAGMDFEPRVVDAFLGMLSDDPLDGTLVSSPRVIALGMPSWLTNRSVDPALESVHSRGIASEE